MDGKIPFRGVRATLRGRQKADVAVIGGGFSGLTIALWLSRAGLRVVLVEAMTIGYGSSAGCAGILAPCVGAAYAKLETERGTETAQACAETQLNALKTIENWCSKDGRHCGFRFVRGMIAAFSAEEAQKLEQEAEAMKKAGLKAVMEKTSNCSFPASAVLEAGPVALLDSAAYLLALQEQAERLGTRFFDHSRVVAVETDVVYTDAGSIQAPYIVVATGYPIINVPGWYFLRMEQRNMQLHRLAGGTFLQNVCFAADRSFSCRPTGADIFLQTKGGLVGSSEGGKTFRTAHHRFLETDGLTAKETISAIETYTPDGLPYIGVYSVRTPNLFVAAGYGGNGLLGSMLAAQAISAQILGLPSKGYEIYSPQRPVGEITIPARMGGRYFKGMIGGPEAPRCSHMGCRLVFNPIVRLWECPCHGSRFDGIGRVVNAPAVRDAHLRGRK